MPDDGQRNCPKHVEFYSKNKFEKLGHLVCFIIRMSNNVSFILGPAGKFQKHLLNFKATLHIAVPCV